MGAGAGGGRGGHTAGRRVGKGGVSWWTFRSPQKCKKKCLQHLEHLATSDMLKMAFEGNGSRRELQSNSEAEEGWLARGKKGQGLGLATGSMEKTENEVTGNFQSRLRLRRIRNGPKKERKQEQGVQKTVQQVTTCLRGQVTSLSSLQVTEPGK